jgi:hypothetical protein
VGHCSSAARSMLDGLVAEVHIKQEALEEDCEIDAVLRLRSDDRRHDCIVALEGLLPRLAGRYIL